MMKHLPHTIKKIDEEALSKEKATSTELVFPSPEQIKKLLEAAIMGGVTDLKEGISEPRELDFKYQNFADKIEAWANKYQFEEIVEFLEKDTG